jgi:hypothetical protein
MNDYCDLAPLLFMDVNFKIQDLTPTVVELISVYSAACMSAFFAVGAHRRREQNNRRIRGCNLLHVSVACRRSASFMLGD